MRIAHEIETKNAKLKMKWLMKDEFEKRYGDINENFNKEMVHIKD